MNVTSPWFLLALPVASILFCLLPGGASRRACLTLLNLAFWGSQVGSPRGAATTACFLASGYAVAWSLNRRPSRPALVAYLLLLVPAFVYLKRYAFLDLFVPAALACPVLEIVGLSYMLFRQIHFLVDVQEGQIRELSPAAYLNYQLDLFCLQAGPLQRYQAFDAYWACPKPALGTREDVLLAYLRVLVGYLKVLAAAWCLRRYSHHAGHLAEMTGIGLTGETVNHMAWLFYGFPAYVYLNFSGYCDMVIGGGSLLGLRRPENFNHPYRSRNMIEFWERWHITLSVWIRDYLFTPLYKTLATRWPAQAAGWAVLTYLVAFFLAGVWHGSSYGFAAFGLIHGIGVSATKLWEILIVRRYGRGGLRRYLQVRPVRALATLATFHFACASFLVFPGGTALLDILKPLLLRSLHG